MSHLATATKRQHGPAVGLTGAQVPQTAGHAGRAFSLENTGALAPSGSQGTVNLVPLEDASLAALPSLSSMAEENETVTNLCPLLRWLWNRTDHIIVSMCQGV